ncbi:hypothetical protein [Flavobacterium pectinovorum]|uniref:Uncharacterized protein n=1 Tax=Flavobacterium pectinovorum TaxID=29533 RepID=A0A502F7F1_9FLAO|nr:hypothetical protein [Flavobacterium pectinovorum]TPG45282.1 hypothetical protein EAH81_01385 [Flavobacterium pectinovorum]
MKVSILNPNKNKSQIPILKRANQLKFKTLEFITAFCFTCCCFSGCDTIYQNTSNILSVKADSSVSKCLRVDGVLSVFPSLKKVYINPTNDNVLKEDILILVFHDKEDLVAFKNKIHQESNKSIANIKLKLDSKKTESVLVQTNSMIPYVLSLNNTTVFKDGLWIVFYSESNQDIETFLEFKRMGVDEIPKTDIIPI